MLNDISSAVGTYSLSTDILATEEMGLNSALYKQHIWTQEDSDGCK